MDAPGALVSATRPAAGPAAGLGPGAARPAAPAPRPAAPLPEARDRFLAFAFAAADLLVEATPEGTIGFAAGAFRARYGLDGADFIGRHASTLVSPLDQVAFAMALASVGLRGRIAPLLLRLSDPHATPACLSALLMPGAPARLCLTFGPAPAAAPEMCAPETALGAGGKSLCRAAVQRVRGAGSGELGLIELKGWSQAKEMLSAADQQSLRSGIAGILLGAGPGALASEVAEGRFGVLAGSATEVRSVVAQLESLIRSGPAARHAQVESVAVNLDHGTLTPAQAARALRFAMSRFAEDGVAGARATVGSGGLASIIARAEARTRITREAIAAGRFRVVFQPIVDLATRAVHHYEALLRPLPLPGSPAQTPQEFVAFAEAMGLAEMLDIAVLEQTCRVLAGGRGLRVAVNVSGLSMQSPTYRAHVSGLLADPAVASSLMLELTETAEIEDMTEAAQSMAHFRQTGVELCLDDFGAGASAFRYLRNFPVDVIKIDGGYVQAAGRSARERGFVVSMLELARSVGARTVAEMIETEQQAEQMRSLGVDLGQGWLFGRPGALPGAMR